MSALPDLGRGLDGRGFHLTTRALCLAIAVMESAPKENRAESDMADWDDMLSKLAGHEATREFYRSMAWNTLASLKPNLRQCEANRSRIKSPPVAATTGGLDCKDLEGLAAISYPQSPCEGKDGHEVASVHHVAFRASSGLTWRYRGKKARVLVMLTTTPGGVTQWDTLPWHTRLGGTIHAMREDGLQISTEIEGPYRHARYRLHTEGELIDLVGAIDG